MLISAGGIWKTRVNTRVFGLKIVYRWREQLHFPTNAYGYGLTKYLGMLQWRYRVEIELKWQKSSKKRHRYLT